MANASPKPNGAAEDVIISMAKTLPEQTWLWPKLMAEACAFWARRFESHAQYWATLGQDLTTGKTVEHNQRFLEQLQRDYAGEGGVFGAALRNSLREAQPGVD